MVNNMGQDVLKTDSRIVREALNPLCLLEWPVGFSLTRGQLFGYISQLFKRHSDCCSSLKDSSSVLVLTWGSLIEQLDVY